ncbi:MAG: ribonuclease E inhibitor RraB [Hyphomonadaceae bacterium]
MNDDHGDDAYALRLAIAHGLNQAQLRTIEFVVDVHERNDIAPAVLRLSERGYECRVWDDPVDGSLSVYAACTLYPTLEAILAKEKEIRDALIGLSISVEDWGAAI